METRVDFVQSRESDMSVNILACLNDPVDVVRAGSVSSLWHHFVYCIRFLSEYIYSRNWWLWVSEGHTAIVCKNETILYLLDWLSIRMETRVDFVQSRESDMSVNILACLNDPVDVVRAGSVSSLWHHFVITNGLSKQLCLRRFPQLSGIERITEPDCITTEANGVGSHNSSWDILKRDHNVYASLLHAITTLNTCQSECIAYAVSASSTDRFPAESVANTLTTRRYLGGHSYWSSKGHADPDAPETLIYKLKADLCVISEISVQPFEAFYLPGHPIYSAKSVRFRLGHPKNSLDENDILQMPQQQPADDKFIWTFTSEVYPMEQKNCLQQFKLPEPVLCIGGYLQIELLSRVQRQHSDNLFYTCVSHVKVMGSPLCPAFDIDILEPSGKFALKYNPEVFRWMLQSFSEDSNISPMPSEEEAVENVGVMGFLLQAYHGGMEPMVWDEPMEWDDDDEEMDELGVL